MTAPRMAMKSGLVVLALGLLSTPGAVWALDTVLAGIRVGSMPTEVTQRYDAPLGIMARRSDGTVEYMGSGRLARLPAGATVGVTPTPTTFGGGQVVTGSTANLGLPPAADIVRVARLGRSQVEWFYLLGDLSVGVVITGQGPDAVVSDVIAASLRSKHPGVVTEKGIRLGDPLSAVIGRYGFPTDGLTTFQSRPSPSGTSVGYGTSVTRPATAPTTIRGAGVGGTEVGVVGESVVVNFDDRKTLFTKCCVGDYGEIDFTFCDLKVVRIHIVD
jgi:hypothetical protein